MYRARVEAVSGTRVYADGKWLKCIGNKCVSVGDRIWTDGRCVYGHFQESQQPQVITAQEEEEGIPIVIKKNNKTLRLLIFQKNKLKDVAEIRYEDGKLKLYNCINGEFVFASDMDLKADKWTDWTLMINDFRKTAFLYDEGTHSKPRFYDSTNLNVHPDDARRHFITDTLLIASNIDKTGTRFDMVVRFYSNIEPYDSFFSSRKMIDLQSVDILQNGKVVQSVPLQPMIGDTLAACPDATAFKARQWTLELGRVGFDVDGNPSVQSFIEDAQTWHFWFYTRAEKEVRFMDVTEGIYDEGSGITFSCVERKYLISANDAVIVSEGIEETHFSGVDMITAEPITNTILTSTAKHRITLPLQDGYYCVATDFFGFIDIKEITEPLEHVEYRNFAVMTFYTPKNEELFKAVLPIYGKFLICKIEGGHLLYVSHSLKNPFVLGEDFDSYKGVPAIGAGLHFIKNGKLTAIEPQISNVINQRLRPMKKIRGWQKRLQTIELEQEEI